MILGQANPEPFESGRVEQQALAADELCIRKGELIGMVQHHGTMYMFMVRDLRREQSTIEGYGVTRELAITAVTQLLQALQVGER